MIEPQSNSFFAHRDGPDFLGSDEFKLRDHILKAQLDATTKLKSVYVRPNVLEQWTAVLKETEHIDAKELHVGDIIEIHFEGHPQAYRFKVISLLQPDILRPENFSGYSPTRLQLVNQNMDGLRCLDNSIIDQGEEIFLIGSSFGGSVTHANYLDRGINLILRKISGTPVLTSPIKKFGVLRPNAEGSIEPLEELELMGLTANKESPPCSKEFIALYDAFSTLSEICPLPIADRSGYQHEVWEHKNLMGSKIFRYSASKSTYNGYPYQVLTVMDILTGTMFEIRSIEHELGKRTFQIRAFKGIKNKKQLKEYGNCDLEIGINHSNDRLLDKTQFYYSWKRGDEGNYCATIDASHFLQHGRRNSHSPYEEKERTACVNENGSLEVREPNEEPVSTELVDYQKMMELIKEAQGVMRMYQPVDRLIARIKAKLEGFL